MAAIASTHRRPSSVSQNYQDSDEDDLEAILFEDVADEGAEASEGESEGTGSYVDLLPPSHPMFSMQGPFEESIEDAERQIELGRNPYEPIRMTADERQQRLLEGGSYNDTYNAKWKEVANSKYHPVVKITAQIAFGVHLLHRRTAESNDEVIRILQRHIDEVDELIRRSEEDITMAVEDIGKRTEHLRIPLEHKDTFQKMLEQRQYRHSVLKGNENIDRIVKRTSILLSDIMIDVRRGLESTQDMLKYFEKIGSTWPMEEATSIGLYEAMLNNTKGWILYFEKLVEMGTELGEQLVDLRDCMRQINAAAAAASKRMATKKSSASLSRQYSADHLRNHVAHTARDNDRLNQPLPPPPPDEPSVSEAVKSALEDLPSVARKASSGTSQKDKNKDKEKSAKSTAISRAKSSASAKISDKRASTATIASLYGPTRAKSRKEVKHRSVKHKQEDQLPDQLPQDLHPVPQIDSQQSNTGGARNIPKKIMAGMGNMPKLPQLSRARRASISEKFGFVRKAGTRSRSASKSSTGEGREGLNSTSPNPNGTAPLAVATAATGLDAVTEVISPITGNNPSPKLSLPKHTPQHSVDKLASMSGRSSPMRLEQAVVSGNTPVRSPKTSASPQPQTRTIARKPVQSPHELSGDPPSSSRGQSPVPTRVDSPASGQRSRMTPSPQPYQPQGVKSPDTSLQDRSPGTSLKDKSQQLSKTEDGPQSATSISTEASASTSTSRSSTMNTIEHPLRMHALNASPTPPQSTSTPTPATALNGTQSPSSDATTPISAATTTATAFTALTTPGTAAPDSRSPINLDSVASPQQPLTFLTSPSQASQSPSPVTTIASPSVGAMAFEESPGIDLIFESPDLGKAVMNRAVNHKVSMSTGSFKPRVVEVRPRSRSRAGTGTGEGLRTRSRSGTITANSDQVSGVNTPLENVQEGLGLGLTGVSGVTKVEKSEPKSTTTEAVDSSPNGKTVAKIESANEQDQVKDTTPKKPSPKKDAATSVRRSLYELPGYANSLHSPKIAAETKETDKEQDESNTVDPEPDAKFEATITDFRRVSIQDSSKLVPVHNVKDDSAISNPPRSMSIKRADTMPVLHSAKSPIQNDAAESSSSMFEGTIRDFARVSVQDASKLIFMPELLPHAQQEAAIQRKLSNATSSASSTRRGSLSPAPLSRESTGGQEQETFSPQITSPPSALTPVKESHEAEQMSTESDHLLKEDKNELSQQIKESEVAIKEVESQPSEEKKPESPSMEEEHQPLLSPVAEGNEPESPRPKVPAKDDGTVLKPVESRSTENASINDVDSSLSPSTHSTSTNPSEEDKSPSHSKSTSISKSPAHSKAPSISHSKSPSLSLSTGTHSKSPSVSKSPSHSKSPSQHSNPFGRSDTMKSFKSYKSSNGKRDTMKSLIDSYYGTAEDADDIPVPEMPDVPDMPDIISPVSVTVTSPGTDILSPYLSTPLSAAPSVPEKPVDNKPEPVTKVTILRGPMPEQTPKESPKIEEKKIERKPVKRDQPEKQEKPDTQKLETQMPKTLEPVKPIEKEETSRSKVLSIAPSLPLLPELDSGGLGLGLGLGFGMLTLGSSSPTVEMAPRSPSPPPSPKKLTAEAIHSEPKELELVLPPNELPKPADENDKTIGAEVAQLPEPDTESPLLGVLESPRLKQDEGFAHMMAASEDESTENKQENKEMAKEATEDVPVGTIADIRKNDEVIKRKAVPIDNTKPATRVIAGAPTNVAQRKETLEKDKDTESPSSIQCESDISKKYDPNTDLEVFHAVDSDTPPAPTVTDEQESEDDMPPPVPPKDLDFPSSMARPGATRTHSGSVMSMNADSSSIKSSAQQSAPGSSSGTKLGQTPKGMSSTLSTRKAKPPKMLDLANPGVKPAAGKGVLGTLTSNAKPGSPAFSVISKISNVASLARGNGSMRSPKLAPPNDFLGVRHGKTFAASTSDLHNMGSSPNTPRPGTSKSMRGAAPFKKLNLFPSSTQSPRLNGFFAKSMSNLRERVTGRDEPQEIIQEPEEDLIGEEADSALPLPTNDSGGNGTADGKKLARSMTQILGSLENQMGERKAGWKRMFRRKKE